MEPLSSELQYGPLWEDGRTLILHTPLGCLGGRKPHRFALGCLWRVSPVAVELMPAEGLLELAKGFLTPLRAAPVGSVLGGHLLIRTTDQHPRWAAYRDPHSRALDMMKCEAIRAGIPHHFKERAQGVREYQTLISLRMPISTEMAFHLAERVEAAYREFSALADGFEAYIQGMRMSPKRLERQSLVDVLTCFLNPHAATPAPFDAGAPISQQVVSTSCTFRRNGITMGDHDASVFSAIRYAPTMVCGALSSPRGESLYAPSFRPWEVSTHPVVITVLAEAIDQAMLQKKLDARQTFTLGQRDSKAEDKVTAASTAFKDVSEAVSDLYAGIPYVAVGTHIVAWHPPAEARLIDLKMKIAAGPVGLHLHREDLLASDIFLRSLPLGYDRQSPPETEICRTQPIRAEYAGAMIPIYGGFNGSRQQHRSYVVNSRAEPITLDLFDTLPAHTIIVGRSRSGKSICCNWLLSDLLETGGSVFILDRYNSYESLAGAYQGLVCRVSPTSPLCLGLFDGPLDEIHRAAIVGVIAELVIAQGDPPLGAAEVAYLTEFVQAYAGHCRMDADAQATLSGFLASVRHQASSLSDSEAMRFATKLSAILGLYAGSGEHSKFLDGPNELTIKPGITVVDVSGLDNVRWLATMLTLMFFYRVDSFVQDPANRHFPKALVADECWKALESEQAASAIMSYAKAFSRFNAAIVPVTQDVSDLLSPVGEVLMSNSSQAISFKLSISEAELFCRKFKMAAHMPEHIAALVTAHDYGDRGDMSEGVYVRADDGAGSGGIFRLVPPQPWLTTVGGARPSAAE